MSSNWDTLAYLAKRDYPMFLNTITAAHNINPELVDETLDKVVSWLEPAFGDRVLRNILDGFAWFTLEVNRAQTAYERSGAYELKSFDEVNRTVYQQNDYMERYYWGALSILFLWPHYVRTLELFDRSFLPLVKGGRLLEIAPGHGFWGLKALERNGDLSLTGVDISPRSLEAASLMAQGAHLGNRSTYVLGDARRTVFDGNRFDAVICSFLLEHLEVPGEMLHTIASCMKPGAIAFITLALTAAQKDHIFEFRDKDDVHQMLRPTGLTIRSSTVFAPHKAPESRRTIPRVQVLIVEKLGTRLT